MNRNLKVLLAFAAGAIAGVVAGVLLAPAKGSDTRKGLAEKGKKFADKVREQGEKWKARANGGGPAFSQNDENID